MSDRTIDAKLIDWLLDGDTGVSSEAMARHLTGRPRNRRWGSDYPHDTGDFGRCARLLRAIPELRPRLHTMAELGPVWAALVAQWDEIERLMRAEVGINWGKGRSAPKTYALIKAIITVPAHAEARNQ